MQKQLTISGTNTDGNRISISEDVGKQYPVKYSFFKDWQGKNTDVYDQYLSLGVTIGQTVNVEITEKQGRNAGGKDVTYRNITRFYDAPEKTPVSNTYQTPTSTTKPPYTPLEAPTNDFDSFKRDVIAGFKVRDEIIKKLSNRVHALEMLTVDFGEEDKKPKTAFEFHRDTAYLVKKEEIPEVFQPIETDVEHITYNEAEEVNKPDYFKKINGND